MARKKYPGPKPWRETKKDRFVALPFNLIDSIAWQHLTSADKAVFITLKRRFNGANNGKISLSVREIIACNKMNINTASKSLKHLQQKGFITLTQPGYWGSHMASTWKINTEKMNGYKPTNEWKEWKPGCDFTNGIPVTK